jgi:hypothetical protein
VPISIVSLVDHDRIWFKPRHSLAVECPLADVAEWLESTLRPGR